MIELFDNAIGHIPKKHIDKSLYLGYVDCYPVWLCVEEGEFRIYHYEEWFEDDIFPDHAGEDWYEEVGSYFGESCEYLGTDTIKYVALDIKTESPLSLSAEIYLACKEELEDISYRLDDGDVPSETLIDFIRDGFEEVKRYKDSLAYGYYK